MTEKQKKFADEYLVDLNATRAYKAAYPSVKKDEAAAAAASRLLKNVKIAEYINKRLKELESKRVANVQEVMEYLTSVVRGEATEEVVSITENGPQYTDKHPSVRDRLKAAELLGKRYALFTEKVEVSALGEEKSKLDDLLKQMRGGG